MLFCLNSRMSRASKKVLACNPRISSRTFSLELCLTTKPLCMLYFKNLISAETLTSNIRRNKTGTKRCVNVKKIFALTLLVLMFTFFLRQFLSSPFTSRSHGIGGVAVKDTLSLSADSVDGLSTCPQSPQSCSAYREKPRLSLLIVVYAPRS